MTNTTYGNHAPINDFTTVGFASIATFFPVKEVSKSLDKFDRRSFRFRHAMNEFIFYVPIMAALENVSADSAYAEIQKAYSTIWGSRPLSDFGSGGLSNARLRIGYECHRDLFERICRPLAEHPHPYTHFAGLRMIAVDGSLLNVADTAKNQEFGRPKNQYDMKAGYPQARIVSLVETGTHAMFAMKIGTFKEGEATLAKEVFESVEPDMLVTADRLYLGWELVNLILQKGAKLLWRFKAGDVDRFHIEGRLPDGSYRAKYFPPKSHEHSSPIDVRILAYIPAAGSEAIYLVTNLLDHEGAPAKDLARVYMQRWEIEMVFNEMKVSLMNGEPFTSQRPELVRQQIYGYALAHYAVRKTIYQAAQTADLDPDEISFTGTLGTIKANCKLFTFSDSLRKQLNTEVKQTLSNHMENSINELKVEITEKCAEYEKCANLPTPEFINMVIDSIKSKFQSMACLVSHTINGVFAVQHQQVMQAIIEEVASKKRLRTSSSRGKSSPRTTKQKTNKKYEPRKGVKPKVKYSADIRLLWLGPHLELQ